MRRRHPVRCLASAVALSLLACEGDPPTTLPDATIEVTTVTTGEAGSDGYMVQLDDEDPLPIGTDATRQLSGLAPGDHEVLLDGLAANCTVTGNNPRTVTVTSGETASTEFQVVCTSAGATLSILIHTTGDSPDPDGYLLSVGTDQPRRVENEATVVVEDLSPGAYTVALADLAPNCSIAEGDTREVGVTEAGEHQVTFDVECAFTGVLTWDTIPLPAGFRPSIAAAGRTIWGTSSSDLFVVGGDGEFAGRGAILHYDGEQWVEQAGFPATELLAIAGSSSTDVSVLGRLSTDDRPALILRYDGSDWSEMPGPVADPGSAVYRDIWAAPGGEAFLVGGVSRENPDSTELLARFDGVAWSEVGAPGLGRGIGLTAVSGTSPTDVWAIGWDWSCDECTSVRSFVTHWDGAEWSVVHESLFPFYTGVMALAPDDVWVSAGNDGSNGTAHIAHWDGVTWTEGPPLPDSLDEPQLNDIWGSSSAGLYAVGDDILLRYDGSIWSKIPGLGGHRIWGTSGNEIFLLGDDHVVRGRP